jgi:hypothetical protein
MIDRARLGSQRRYAVVLVLLSVASLLLYAAGVLLLRQDRVPGWALEGAGALPAAASHVLYGTPLGAMNAAVWGKFAYRGETSVQDVLAEVANKAIPAGPVERTTFDGGGAGTNVFATIAMWMFGLKISSLVWLYLLMTGVSVGAFALRFHDRRLIVLPIYFLIATIMLLTPLGTSAMAVDQMPIGGQRYFVMATFIPALHIFFDVIDRNSAVGLRQTVTNALLLLLQALLLFGALLVRSSAAYVLGVLLAVWIWRLYRDRRQPAQRNALLRNGGVVVCAFSAWFIFVATSLPAYLQSGRVLGNVWHRAFISFTFHPDWPFGNLRQVYDCTQYIPEGLNRVTTDRNGHCIWWIYPPNTERPTEEVNTGTYDGEYEKALRQAYFYVIFHYPKQAFELYAYYKSGLIAATLAAAWNALVELPHAPVTNALFVVLLAQFLVFVAFVISVARAERTVVDLPLAIFPLFFIASIPQLYVAWAGLWTGTDLVFLMYSCLLLAVLLLVQLVGQAILPRAKSASDQSVAQAG